MLSVVYIDLIRSKAGIIKSNTLMNMNKSGTCFKCTLLKHSRFYFISEIRHFRTQNIFVYIFLWIIGCVDNLSYHVHEYDAVDIYKDKQISFPMDFTVLAFSGGVFSWFFHIMIILCLPVIVWIIVSSWWWLYRGTMSSFL
jgi:hypothetical protein